MDDQHQLDLITCPHCGARRPKSGERCWLCGLYVSESAGTIRPIEPVRPMRSNPGLKNAAAILVGLLVALLALDLFNQAPGLAIVMLVIVVPAFIALGVTIGREGADAPSFGGVFAVVMFSVVGLLLSVGLVVAAAIAAIMAFCSILFDIGPR
jgi:hypothetical protein